MSRNDRDQRRDSREEWLEALFRRHHASIRAYALRRAPEDADDIVSDVFAIAWRKQDEAPEHPLPWLYAIAARETLHALRSARRREYHHRRAAAQAEVMTPDDTDAVDARVSAEDPVRRAMAQLSERDTEILRLWAWERLEPAEIATALGISHTAARVRLHRARARMERLLSLREPRQQSVVRREPRAAVATTHGGSR